MSATSDLRSAAARRAQPVDGILGAIGDTPLVSLHRYLLRPDVALWAKLEASNPGGSAKDRPAARMLQDALDDGLIDLGTTVVESTSGNTGVGLAQACRYHGMRLICVVDTRAHETNVRAMRALGADVRVVAEPDPETGDLLVARLALVAAAAGRDPQLVLARSVRQRVQSGRARLRHDARDRRGARRAGSTTSSSPRAPPARCAAAATTCASTGAARASSRWTRPGARSSAAGAAPAGSPASAPASRPICPQAPSSTSSCASPTSTASSAAAGSPSARRSSAGASSGGVAFAVEALAAQMEPGSRCAAIFADGGAGYLETRLRRRLGRARARLPPARLAALVAERGDRIDACAPIARRVAIAGLGPKGLFALERLLDHARGLPGTRSRSTSSSPSARPARGRSTTRASRTTCA